MENFKQFCINATNPVIPDIDPDAEKEYPEYDTIIEHVSDDIKNKMEFLDRVSIPCIEGKFDKLDDIGKILEFMHQEDIPDGLLNTFSYKVFDCHFNTLSNDKRSIIAVLSVYILIYNFRGGFPK
jgi:hypothetical protein